MTIFNIGDTLTVVTYHDCINQTISRPIGLHTSKHAALQTAKQFFQETCRDDGDLFEESDFEVVVEDKEMSFLYCKPLGDCYYCLLTRMDIEP